MEAGQLIERDEDLAAVAGLIAAAVNGDGRVALIEGPAGGGKTALLQEGRGRATGRGAREEHARPSELERGFAYRRGPNRPHRRRSKTLGDTSRDPSVARNHRKFHQKPRRPPLFFIGRAMRELRVRARSSRRG